jgi:hypothetical protein
MTKGVPMTRSTAFALVAATVVLGYGVYFLAKGRILAGVVVAFLGSFTLLGMSAIVRRGKVGTTSLLVALPLLGLLSIALSIIDFSLIGLALGSFLVAGGVLVFVRWRRDRPT